MFSHEKFEAYKLSIQYWEDVLKLLKEIPPGNSAIKEQFKQSASSIALNIAEGTGRTKPMDRKRFYAIARGSTLECAAISDLLVKLEPQLKTQIDNSKKSIYSIANILSAVILK